MSILENPIALSRSAQDLQKAWRTYCEQLARAEIDPSGPFAYRPALTEREAFREIREAPLPEELKAAWLRWAFHLADARVNGAAYAAIAEAYRVERHIVEWTSPLHVTPRELLHRALTNAEERTFFFDAFSAKVTRVQGLVFELWARRKELARRAGFENSETIEDPGMDMVAVATSLLERTRDLHRQIVPLNIAGLLERALAREDDAGWPAQLNPRSLYRLLGDDAWLHGLPVTISRLPRAIAPSSFCRGLARVGANMVDAAAPASQPFVVAHDPNGLLRRTVGALLGSLPRSPLFLSRALDLSRSRAGGQIRHFAVASLIHVRLAALACLVRAKIRSEAQLTRTEYDALSEDVIGFALPASLCGVLPRLHADSGQRLLGPLLCALWSDRLVAEYDEDWFRNPRGIAAVRERIDAVPETASTAEQAELAVNAYVNRLEQDLG
jgi:hypothetical protein